MFRVFLGKRRRIFSAVQTAWRREQDSNPRYRSETCKSRRLRRLRGINQFRVSPETACSPFDALNSAVSTKFLRRSAGDCVAESGHLRSPQKGQIGSHVTACLPRSPKSEKYLRRMCSSKGEWLAILGRFLPMLSDTTPPLGGEQKIPIRQEGAQRAVFLNS